MNNTEKVDPDTGITTVTLQFPKTFEADANILDLYDDFLKDLATDASCWGLRVRASRRFLT